MPTDPARTTDPAPAAGAPDEGWIRTVAPQDATGLLAEAYGRQLAALGEVTALTRSGSLYPELVDQRLRLYAVVDATPSGIPDVLRRGLALLTSVLNGCLFCTLGHVAKLTEAGQQELAEAIRADPEGFRTGREREDALYDYARALTRTPGSVRQDQVERLRAAGWDDLDLLDANNLVAYYNYINRVASGLGLQREA
ncbi:MAG TPA: peroxidase-related enzyme [Cellulomonas sp.]